MLRQVSILFVALLVGVALFVWIEGYSSTFQKCVGQGSAQAATQNSQNENNPVRSFVAYTRCSERFAEAHNPLITALASVLLAAITFGLILSGVDQQKTTRAQLRSYLSVETGTNFRQSQKKAYSF
jgi:hypothetical protein